jgi:hypothetical protein
MGILNILLPDIMPKPDTLSRPVLPMASIRPGKIIFDLE